MKKIISLLIIGIMLTACAKKFETIATNKALELINNGAIVIDVREVDEYNQGHIAGAVNLPLGQIDSITYDKDTTIILYCATGIRSLEAVNKLSDMGYTALYNLDGGLLNWGESLEG